MIFLRNLVTALLFILMAAGSALAAEPEGTVKPEGGGYFANIQGAISEFSKETDKKLAGAMKAAALKVAAKSTGAALVIGGSLALMYLLYEMTQFLSGKTKSMLVVLFDVGIPCIFAALMIKQYDTILLQFESILDVLRRMGAENPLQAIMSTYGAVLENGTQAIAKAFNRIGDSLDPRVIAVQIVDLFLTGTFALGIVALLLIGVSEILGLLLMGPFLFAVGVAFGPICIAGIVSPWTRDYFTKWLQFLVISAGLTAVINVIFTLAAEIMKSMEINSHAGGEPTAVAMLIMAVLIMTVNSMISQAPSIASALFPGHVGVSKSNGSAAASFAKPTSAATKAVGRGAGTVLKKGAAFTKGALAKTKSKQSNPSTP